MEPRQAIERALVCAAFQGSDCVDLIDSQIQDMDFSDTMLRRIWVSIRALVHAGEPPDPVLVLERLAIGGGSSAFDIATLVELSGASWESSHIDHYCESLKRYATTDDARLLGEQLAGELVVDREVIDQYITRLDEIERGRRDEIHTAAEAVAALRQRKANPLAIHPTGIGPIDFRIRGGLRDGQLVVVGGRPGAGKSVMLMQMACGVADRGESALIVSLEMPQDEIVERLSRTRTHEQISAMPLFFIDSTSDLGTIVSLVRVACRRFRIGVVVVDYLQLAEVAHQRGSNREREIAMISRRLKRLAMDIKRPIIVGSQLNRESTKRGKPTLADLRESGAIEQDSDIVILLSKSEDGPESLVDIAKQRGGGTGEITMRLNGPEFRFECAEEEVYNGRLVQE